MGGGRGARRVEKRGEDKKKKKGLAEMYRNELVGQ